MIAALNRLSGFPLPGPQIEIAKPGQCAVPGSLRNTALKSRHRGCNDGE